MIAVLDSEVQPEYRYLGPEIQHHLGDASYHEFVDDPTAPNLDDVDGVVLSGSTAAVYEEGHEAWLEPEYELVHACIDQEVPLLGICFGHQAVNVALGGHVEKDRSRRRFVEMERLGVEDDLLDGAGSRVPVLHSDLVVELGEGLVPTAETDYNPYFCTRHESAPVWTVQFHPELTERVADRPSEFDPDEGAWEGVTAHRVLTNFGDVCRRRS